MNTSAILLREIEISDIPQLFSVRIATWHNPRGAIELQELGITPLSVEKLLRTSHKGWLCESEGKVIGFAIGDRSTGELWVIAVLKQFEGLGIGRRLLSEVEAWLRSSGWKRIWLTTDTDERFRAVGFYRRMGWMDWKIESGDRFMQKLFPD